MTTATFDAAGGPITIAVSCQPNRNGSYTLILWEALVNKVVAEFRGNFLNTDDDSYPLDKPNAAHDGRLVEAMVVVAIPAGVGPSDVVLTVSQDGAELARETGTVAPGSPGQLVDLFITLAKKP
jgi:hypothetical protein